MKQIPLCITVTLFSIALTSCWQPSKPNLVKDEPTPVERSTSPTPTATSTPSNMANSNSQSDKASGFFANVPSNFERPTDGVGNRLLKEYGAVFVARGGAKPPAVVIFPGEASVSSFQNSLDRSTDTVGGISIELQRAAMDGLRKAISEANQAGKKITPRGADAARRNYSGTVELWKSRVDPGLAHWSGKGKITTAEASRIKGLTPFEQVTEILRLEEQGMFFAKDLSKSIIYSVAPPGTSQHLSMLALDITEHDDAKVREIMAKNGWHQTVVSDLPHFTFLGVTESEMPALGLKKVTDGGRSYWLPSI